jgi:cytochrome c2
MKAQVLLASVLLAAASAASAADVKQGQAIFREQCGLCHTGGPGDGDGGQGPNLNGVVGRKAGSLPGFPYTPALKASGLVWTSQNLDRFLTDPAKLVPGTAMPVSISDPKARQDVVGYLETLHGR